jgi:hypothetical protein
VCVPRRRASRSCLRCSCGELSLGARGEPVPGRRVRAQLTAQGEVPVRPLEPPA